MQESEQPILITHLVGCEQADSLCQVLRYKHVNVLDFIDARRAHRQVELHHSASALAEYTRETERFFPLKDAKGEKLIKILLRHIA